MVLKSNNPINIIIYRAVIDLCKGKDRAFLLETYAYNKPSNTLSHTIMELCLLSPLVPEPFKARIVQDREASHLQTVVYAGIFIDTWQDNLVVKINWTPYHLVMDMSQVDQGTALSFYQLSDILLWEPEFPQELEEAFYEELVDG